MKNSYRTLAFAFGGVAVFQIALAFWIRYKYGLEHYLLYTGTFVASIFCFRFFLMSSGAANRDSQT